MQIELTQGRFALVSPEDFPALQQYRWHAAKCGSNKFYARRGVKFGKKVVAVSMHRQIMADSLSEGLVVDHINGDTMDNRRENLRVVTPSENSRNLRAFSGVSGYRGVFAQGNGFSARIAKDYLGYFETDVEAAFAVNAKLTELDAGVGVRNQIDYTRLLAILHGRRSVIESQIQAVMEAKC